MPYCAGYYCHKNWNVRLGTAHNAVLVLRSQYDGQTKYNPILITINAMNQNQNLFKRVLVLLVLISVLCIAVQLESDAQDKEIKRTLTGTVTTEGVGPGRKLYNRSNRT